MSLKNRLLFDIRQALELRGENPGDIWGIPTLRSLYPGLSAQYSDLGLNQLAQVLAAIPTANLDEWRTSPPPKSRGDGRRKTLLSNQEIWEMSQNRVKQIAIAQEAGCSKSNVQRILAAERKKRKRDRPIPSASGDRHLGSSTPQ